MAFVHLRSSLWIVSTVAMTMAFLNMSSAAPASDEKNRAMMYLVQYGYLSPSVLDRTSGPLNEKTWKNAISEFQGFVGLNKTGELSEDTVKQMSLPRCGVKDKFGSSKRAKRYAFLGPRWRVKDLTYKISKYPSRLNYEEVDTEMAKAFAVWSDVTDLTFTQKRNGPVYIDIRFEEGYHGDNDPFDGPVHRSFTKFNVLAHATEPRDPGSYVHFDDTEFWTINSEYGINLFQVAAHEFGHVLGLNHSQVPSALMAPTYKKCVPYFQLYQDDILGIQVAAHEFGHVLGLDHSQVPSALMAPTYKECGPYFQLDEDDILGIQDLYGPKTRFHIGRRQRDIRSSRMTTSKANATLCSTLKIDTIFNYAGSTYIFKGDQYWQLTQDGVAEGFPRPISSSWPGLPGKIDAAFTYKDGKTYFFKNSTYWRYNGHKMDRGYPKKISEGFTGIPDNIDAALVSSGNDKIFFYKGSQYWSFDPTALSPINSAYPKPMSNWIGIPDNVDGALLHTDGYAYFFKDESYWRFNYNNFTVDSSSPAFPRSIGYWWLGCSSAPRGTIGGNAPFSMYIFDASRSEEQQRAVLEKLTVLNSKTTYTIQ